MKYEEFTQPVMSKHIPQKSMTLQKANDQTMHAFVLASITFERKLDPMKKEIKRHITKFKRGVEIFQRS